MNRTAIISALMGLLAACAPGVQAGEPALARGEAGRALYGLPLDSGLYSFSDVFRMSLEAETSLISSTPPADPFGTPALILPAGLSESAAMMSAGPVAASQKSAGSDDISAAQPWALPRPDGWLTVMSVLAIIGFIAWRRSEGVD